MTDVRSDLPRSALACWDYSWLIRRSGRRAEYLDLDQAVAQLADRGYTALRVDAFPHLVALDLDGHQADRFELFSCQDDLGRGRLRGVSVEPRRELIALCRAASRHGVRLWLTSWFLPDRQARRHFVRSPHDQVRVWTETLGWIHRHGYLDAVLAVDFCHQFPLLPAAWGAYRRVFGASPRTGWVWSGLWPARACRQVETFLQQVPQGLRARFPGIRYGCSLPLTQLANLQQVDTTAMDFVDLHCWLQDDVRFRVASGQMLRDVLPLPGLAQRVQGQVAGLVYRHQARYWMERAAERLAPALEFARVRRLQPVLSEGFVRVGDERRANWDFVAQVSEQMIDLGLREQVPVLTTALQSRPHSPGFWQRLDWHRQQTARIVAAPAGTPGPVCGD